MKLVSDVEHPSSDRVERGFCSARQAYAQEQQEKETSAPIPKKHPEYGVSQGQLLGEAR